MHVTALFEEQGVALFFTEFYLFNFRPVLQFRKVSRKKKQMNFSANKYKIMHRG